MFRPPLRPVRLVQDLLLRTAARLPDKPALVCTDGRFTYAEILARAATLAAELAERGVGRGDRVIVFADNAALAALAFWAVPLAGAVVSIVHPQTRAERLRWLLDDAGAAALITQPHLAAEWEPAVEGQATLRAVLTALPAARPDAMPPRPSNIDLDLAAIIYTSGSTGEPKGVMLTHANVLAACTSILEYLGTAEDDVTLGMLPLSFDYGLYQWIMSVATGGTLVLERGAAYPAWIVRRIVDQGVTIVPVVPMIATQLMHDETARAADFSRVRTVTNTAAALESRHVAGLRALFPRARLFSMYGLTECKRCTYLPPEDLDRKPGSVGIAIPGTEVWVIDEDGRRLGPGATGQLVVRGRTVMQGYWNKPEHTARRLAPGPLPGERVLLTGDLCRMDDEGYVWFVARMDSIIKSRGEKVAPREVEQAILALPGVRDVAVIGVPDELLGEAVKAFVVLEPGAVLDERDVVNACQRRLEGFKVPKSVSFVDELPRTTTGKVSRHELA